MNLHFPSPRIFSLIQRAMPQAFGNASNSNTQSELCLQQHCLAKHKKRARFYSSAQQQPKVWDGTMNDSRNQHQTKEKATCIAPLTTQTALLYKNHTLHKKPQTMTIFHLL